MTLKGLQTVSRLANDMIHFGQSSEMTFGKALLVGDEDVGLSCANPAGKNPLHKNVAVKADSLRKKRKKRGGATAMTYRDPVAGSYCNIMNKIDIAVESHSVCSGNDIEVKGHGD